MCSCFTIQRTTEKAACDSSHLSLLVLSFAAGVISPARAQKETVIESAYLARRHHCFNLSCIPASGWVIGSRKNKSLGICPEDADGSARVVRWVLLLSSQLNSTLKRRHLVWA